MIIHTFACSHVTVYTMALAAVDAPILRQFCYFSRIFIIIYTASLHTCLFSFFPPIAANECMALVQAAVDEAVGFQTAPMSKYGVSDCGPVMYTQNKKGGG